MFVEYINKMREKHNEKKKEIIDDENLKVTEDGYKIFNVNNDCPYGMCNGQGEVSLLHIKSREYKSDKCSCIEEKEFREKIISTGIPKEFFHVTIGSFNIELYQDEKHALRAKKCGIKFVDKYESFESMGKGLYFHSETKGSGKTRLAISVGLALMKVKNKSIKFVKTVSLIERIKATWNSKSEETQLNIIYELTNVDVLILDDIGAEISRDWVTDIIYSILDNRMTEKKVTLFTSNIPITGLNHDSRIISRIEKMAIEVTLPEENVRGEISSMENIALKEILFNISDEQ